MRARDRLFITPAPTPLPSAHGITLFVCVLAWVCVRGKDASGVMRYQFLESSVEPLARMARVSDQLLLSITASGNIVVIKTPPGGAQLLASALDRASESSELSNAIGTIAGDDTVLVISRNASGGKLLAAELRDYIATEFSSKARKTGKSKKARR